MQKGGKMGRKVETGESEVLECIRDLIDVSIIPPSKIAEEAGMTRAQLYNFVRYSKGTQLIQAEKILDALGFELYLKKKKGI